MQTTETYLNDLKNLGTVIFVRQVKDEDKKRYFFGYAKGISREGLFIQTTCPKEEKMKFNLEFSLPKDGKSIECKAEVVWRREFIPGAFNEPGMALKFLDLDEKLVKKIDRWIKTH